MKKIKQFSKILLVSIFLSSCSSQNIQDYPTKNLNEDTNNSKNTLPQRMEIKFSCGEDGISEYLDDGWTIIKEDAQEKVCTWKSVPAIKGCDMEKDKGCKITKPDNIGEEKIYILEK